MRTVTRCRDVQARGARSRAGVAEKPGAQALQLQTLTHAQDEKGWAEPRSGWCVFAAADVAQRGGLRRGQPQPKLRCCMSPSPLLPCLVQFE